MSRGNKNKKIAADLAKKPGHQKVAAYTFGILTDELGVDSASIDFEKKTVNGRIDAITGNTVFEFKRDLRSEGMQAEDQLTRYLTTGKEKQKPFEYIGIATDGSEYRAYVLDKEGRLHRAETYKTDADNPESLFAWLGRICVFETGLQPDFENIKAEFGKHSLIWKYAEIELRKLWDSVKDTSTAQLKYQLWQQLLSAAYGTDIDDISLFLRHSYLTILAKTIAWAALLHKMPATAADIISSKEFEEKGIIGFGGEDFFGWIAHAQDSDIFVKKLTVQAGRFTFTDATTDIMKGLYESLIDPEERHDLGEYYTPDWLAARICEEAIDAPLSQKILDPSCGSGTFIFHAIRHIIDRATMEYTQPVELALKTAIENVKGIDIHPVAVITAQVTFLLALLPELEEANYEREIVIPIYLGDSLQWNLQQADAGDLLSAEQDGLSITVPPHQTDKEKLSARTLTFPKNIITDENIFNKIIDTIFRYIKDNSSADDFHAWMKKQKAISEEDYEMLIESFEELDRLHKQGRNHIWGYVARNLSRPIYLSSDMAKVDILIGNPPWVAYRFMSGAFKEQFKKACAKTGLWVGGRFASNQDLCAYFFMRAAELYLKPEGKIAFIMPEATLTREQYKKFRQGYIHNGRDADAHARFRIMRAWGLGADLQPLFPVPACVLFAQRQSIDEANPLPKNIIKIAGILPHRNIEKFEADLCLTSDIRPYPKTTDSATQSAYFKNFRTGASLIPRRFVFVNYLETGGTLPSRNIAEPHVRGKGSNLDKAPWRDIAPPEGRIEEKFLYPIVLGASIAPFRQLNQETGIIPIDKEQVEKGHNNKDDSILLDSQTALNHGYTHLSQWMKNVETLWEKHRNSNMTLFERWNYNQDLVRQFPPAPLRVAYAGSGTHVAAAIIDENMIIESKLLWAEVSSLAEAYYLLAILNSQTAEDAVRPYQSQGQWGARDFGKHLLFPPWPRFQPDNALHKELVAAAEHAEKIASFVSVPEDLQGMQFQKVRRNIRAALKEDGIAEKINQLTAKLLNDAES